MKRQIKFPFFKKPFKIQNNKFLLSFKRSSIKFLFRSKLFNNFQKLGFIFIFFGKLFINASSSIKLKLNTKLQQIYPYFSSYNSFNKLIDFKHFALFFKELLLKNKANGLFQIPKPKAVFSSKFINFKPTKALKVAVRERNNKLGIAKLKVNKNKSKIIKQDKKIIKNLKLSKKNKKLRKLVSSQIINSRKSFIFFRQFYFKFLKNKLVNNLATFKVRYLNFLKFNKFIDLITSRIRFKNITINFIYFRFLRLFFY